MKSPVAMMAGMIFLVASAQAADISFDPAEGYENGKLDGQPRGGDYIWNTDFQSSGWQVENGGARVTSSANRWVTARWSEPVSGPVISQMVSFTLTRTLEAATEGVLLFVLGVSDAMDRLHGDAMAGNNVYVGLVQSPGIDEYILTIHSNHGQSKDKWSYVFKGGEIGLGVDGEKSTSGPLRLAVKHVHHGGDAWTTSATLTHESAEVASVSLDFSAAENAGWSEAEKYLLLSSADMSLQDGVVVDVEEVSIAADEQASTASDN